VEELNRVDKKIAELQELRKECLNLAAVARTAKAATATRLAAVVEAEARGDAQVEDDSFDKLIMAIVDEGPAAAIAAEGQPELAYRINDAGHFVPGTCEAMLEVHAAFPKHITILKANNRTQTEHYARVKRNYMRSAKQGAKEQHPEARRRLDIFLSSLEAAAANINGERLEQVKWSLEAECKYFNRRQEWQAWRNYNNTTHRRIKNLHQKFEGL